MVLPNGEMYDRIFTPATTIVMSNVDFETATKQEEVRLQKLHPTPEDIPGCMSMFDNFLSCNGMGMGPQN